MTRSAVICQPRDDLRTSPPGSLGQGPTTRQSRALPAEAVGRAGPGGPRRGPGCAVDLSSTVCRYRAGVAMVHATMGIRPPPEGSKAWIPTITWTIGPGVHQPKINVRLRSRRRCPGRNLAGARPLDPIGGGAPGAPTWAAARPDQGRRPHYRGGEADDPGRGRARSVRRPRRAPVLPRWHADGRTASPGAIGSVLLDQPTSVVRGEQAEATAERPRRGSRVANR